METTETPENAFPFICSNSSCSKSYDIKAFADAYMLWGYIFLTCGDKCIIGLTCPECNHTTVKRFSAMPLDFSVTQIDNLSKEGPNVVYSQQSTIYFIKFSVSLLSDSESVPDTDDAVSDIYSIPSDFVPIRYIPAFEQIKPEIDANKIEELLKIENDQNSKVFSRIVAFNSVYYLSDVWIQNIEALTPKMLEEFHNSLEILYTKGYNHQLGINTGPPQKPYMSLIKSDLTPDEYQGMDRSLYAWNTGKFQDNIKAFLNEYKKLRNQKDFELTCYNDLINKYARICYHNPGLVEKQNIEDTVRIEEAKLFEEPEQEEEFEFDEDRNSIFPDSQINTSPIPAVQKDIEGPHADIIKQLNKKHAVVDYAGQILIMNEKFDPSLERPYQSFSKKTDFFDKYANKLITDPNNPKKEISIAHYWWKHEDRRTYEGIVFSPGKNIPGFYNLWQGYAINPIQGNWSFFRNHIFNIISNRDKKIFEWIMGWMARIVQDPGGNRPGTAIVLRGGQGTGKTFFARIFGKLFGRHYLYLSQSSHLTGQFNHHLKDALVVFVDEGFLVGDKKSEGLLKSMVTEPVLNIEQKFRDLTTVKNHINMIVASNNKYIVPAGLDERRFFVTDISEEQKQNKPYFKAIEDQMNNDGYEAMRYDLEHWTYDMDTLRTIPKTNALFDQKLNNMSVEIKFWYKALQKGRILNGQKDWQEKIPFHKIHTEYEIFPNNKNPMQEKQFSAKINQFCKGIQNRHPRDANKKKVLHKIFPPLEKCREDFENYLKINTGDIKWSQIEASVTGPNSSLHFPM